MGAPITNSIFEGTLINPIRGLMKALISPGRWALEAPGPDASYEHKLLEQTQGIRRNPRWIPRHPVIPSNVKGMFFRVQSYRTLGGGPGCLGNTLEQLGVVLTKTCLAVWGVGRYIFKRFPQQEQLWQVLPTTRPEAKHCPLICHDTVQTATNDIKQKQQTSPCFRKTTTIKASIYYQNIKLWKPCVCRPPWPILTQWSN